MVLDSGLKGDLDRFFRVYLNNVDEILHGVRLSEPVRRELADEFEAFRASIINRIEEYERAVL